MTNETLGLFAGLKAVGWKHPDTYYRHMRGRQSTTGSHKDQIVPVAKFCRITRVKPESLRMLMTGEDRAISSADAAKISGVKRDTLVKHLQPIVGRGMRNAQRYSERGATLVRDYGLQSCTNGGHGCVPAHVVRKVDVKVSGGGIVVTPVSVSVSYSGDGKAIGVVEAAHG